MAIISIQVIGQPPAPPPPPRISVQLDLTLREAAWLRELVGCTIGTGEPWEFVNTLYDSIREQECKVGSGPGVVPFVFQGSVSVR